MSERSAGVNIALVSLLAGLLGAVIGLLFAPRSGKQTRENLRLTAKDMGRQAAEQTLDEVHSQIARGLRQAKIIGSKITDKLNQAENITDHQHRPVDARSQLAPNHLQRPIINWDKEN